MGSIRLKNLALVFSFLWITCGNLTATELSTTNHTFPVSVDFPGEFSYSLFENPVLPGYYVHVFQVYDEPERQFFTVNITELPLAIADDEDALRREIAQQTLATQIEVFESATGYSSTIEYSEMEYWNGYSTMHTVLSRNSDPRTFGEYIATVIDQWSIIIWSMGADTKSNRARATSFISKVQFK